MPDFLLTAKAVAKRLEISTQQASMIIETLKDVGLIARSAGRWRQAVPPLRVPSKQASDAGRRFTRSLLHKAEAVMDTTPFEQRNMSSICFAMSTNDVGYAAERIRDFRRDLCSDLEAKSTPDSVYALSLQLIPLAGPARSAPDRASKSRH